MSIKKNKVMKQLFMGGISISLILSASIANAEIRDTNFTVGRTFNWAPYTDSYYINTGATGGYPCIIPNFYFHFDATGANTNNNSLYFTMEENNVADGLALDAQYSNIPNPHFDSDDDNDDGYAEESEVVTNGYNLTANTNYYFRTWWKNTKSTVHPGGTVNFIAQRSILNPINGEYEGWHYDLLAQKSYGRVSPKAYALGIDSLNSDSIEIKEKDQITKDESEYSVRYEKINNNSKEINTHIKETSKGELDNYGKTQKNKLNLLLKNNKSLDDSGIVTVTFEHPISVNRLKDILDKNNAQLKDFEVKFTNDNENWITGNFKAVNEELINDVKNQSVSSGAEKYLDYKGITSARIVINLADKAYNTLCNQKDIFFVDVTESIIRLENIGYQGKLKIRVPDLAWRIKDFK